MLYTIRTRNYDSLIRNQPPMGVNLIPVKQIQRGTLMYVELFWTGLDDGTQQYNRRVYCQTYQFNCVLLEKICEFTRHKLFPNCSLLFWDFCKRIYLHSNSKQHCPKLVFLYTLLHFSSPPILSILPPLSNKVYQNCLSTCIAIRQTNITAACRMVLSGRKQWYYKYVGSEQMMMTGPSEKELTAR